MVRGLWLPHLIGEARQRDPILADITVHVYAAADRFPKPLLENGQDLRMPPQVPRVQQLYLRERAGLGLGLFDYALHQGPR